VRSFKTAFSEEFLQNYQQGVLQYQHRGVPCLKSPIDLAIYSRAMWDIKPGAVIEIGTKFGGSALWFSDTLRAFGNPCPVISIDLEVPTGIEDDHIQFIQGDAMELSKVFKSYNLESLPRPWLVSEDSAHTYTVCMAVLTYLSQVLQPGDLLVMEDGNLDEMGLSERYDGGPNRALAEFLTTRPDVFEIATSYCDMFGMNATYAPNGYLFKT
jgi:cephalosporin hydroxylase